MNPKNSWQYHPLTIERQSQRDALIRVLIRVMQALAQRKLVPYHNYACEQYVERRIPRGSPGCYDYRDERVEYASTEWLRDHAEGRLRLECILQVDAEDRIAGEGLVTDGDIIADLFAVELQLLEDRWRAEQQAPSPPPKPPAKRKAAKKAKAPGPAPVKSATPPPARRPKPKPLEARQCCLFEF